MEQRLEALLNDLGRAETLAGSDLARSLRRTSWLAEAAGDSLDEFLQAAARLPTPLAKQADQMLAAALGGVVRQRLAAAGPTAADAGLGDSIERLYGALGKSSLARAHLLAWLALGDKSELERLADLLISDPPAEDAQVMQAIAPLFRRGGLPVENLFPRLLDALEHRQLAAPILDLANYLTREGLVAEHPAAERSGQLIVLLGDLTQSLLQLEENSESAGLSPVELSRRIAGCISLSVSLCDALGLIGNREAVGKLTQTIEIRHRRLRTEAAAALARLGDPRGADELVLLAAEPVARLRVLAYAGELGLEDKIDPALQTAQARAESELVVWLSEPTQFGIPPSSMELFDHRRQFWPGYQEPVECFLFRFTYAVTVEGEGERSFSNIGIAGPLAHAFLVDLADLPPDDIYAAYAGWQAEHEEIREYDVASLSRSEKLEVERLVRRLHDAQFTAIEPQRMGYFFGGKALIAAAARDGMTGVAIADFDEIDFFPRRHSRRPLGAAECYCIYKGRKLLKLFNHGEQPPAE
ncbi:MAG: HEAT repeat domain-containing protein [Pirellulaceae bacterium]